MFVFFLCEFVSMVMSCAGKVYLVYCYGAFCLHSYELCSSELSSRGSEGGGNSCAYSETGELVVLGVCTK